MDIKQSLPRPWLNNLTVSKVRVHLVLLIATLNDLTLLSADTQTTFLTTPNKEKVYLKTGSEFGANAGKIYMVIDQQ